MKKKKHTYVISTFIAFDERLIEMGVTGVPGKEMFLHQHHTRSKHVRCVQQDTHTNRVVCTPSSLYTYFVHIRYNKKFHNF